AAADEATGEDAVGGDPHAELAARRQDLVLDVALQQGVLDLQVGDRGDRGRPPDRRGADLREPDVPQVALLDQLGDRADGVLDRDGRVEAGGPVDVDVVDAQALQRVAEEVPQRGGAGVDALWRTVGAAQYTELHREHDGVAVAGPQRSADQRLVVAGAVEVTSVDQ